MSSSSKRQRMYHFNSDCEEICGFIQTKDKGFCLICNSTVSVLKKYSHERNLKINHNTFDVDYPPKTELRKRKINLIKSRLSAQQAVFTNSANINKNAAVTSFKIFHLLQKK
ncbi:hypothetical protein NPIL_298081 [Nephila pilipes]|uniref:Uncharacterized protein n=1 Tax=Nephila pilipes TaxID=299642 RepID=A0A8X6PQ52_NEPPI|nr:hypothetical protein NPIL_298081 [Nephila pilipes]